MIIAPIPTEEEERQLELLSCRILDTDEEEDYAALVKLAAEICNCEGAAITFIDRNRQWFKSSKNIPLKEMPRDISFCGHTILHNDVMIVDDMSVDERFFDNPLVIGEFKVGFYAGAPIITSAGNKLGTVCVLDHAPKHASLSPQQKQTLTVIATQVMRLLELRSKNMLITEQAEQLIEADKRIARMTIINAEQQNEHIAYELHENIAQLIAATKIKLSCFENKIMSKAVLSELQDYFSLILKDVRSLSYELTPTTLKSSDYSVHIQEMVTQFSKSRGIEIILDHRKDKMRLTESFGLNVFRMIQYFLSYAALSHAQHVNIIICSEPKSLQMNHDGKTDSADPDAVMLLLNKIQTHAGITNSDYSAEHGGKSIRVIFKDAA